MSELVADCPRCGSRRITFDVTQEHKYAIHYSWQNCYEAFCICRHCRRSTVFFLHQDVNVDTIGKHGILKLDVSVNRFMRVEGFVNISNVATADPAEHVPEDIKATFEEGAKCLAFGAYNAAGTMFRLCLDLATRPLLPADEIPGLNRKTRRDLGLRLPWLFDNQRLPEALRDLSSCIKEDGNDGAHAGSLGKPEAEDVLEFTSVLLERLYTEPERLRLASVRRAEKREKDRIGSG